MPKDQPMSAANIGAVTAIFGATGMGIPISAVGSPGP